MKLKIAAALVAALMVLAVLPVGAHAPSGGVPGEVAADTPSPDGADCFDVYEGNDADGWTLSDVTIPQISAVINRHYSAGYPVDTSATRPNGDPRLPGYNEKYTDLWNTFRTNNPSPTNAERATEAARILGLAEDAGDAAVAAAIEDLLDGAHTHRVECPEAAPTAPSSPRSFISGYARPAGSTGGTGCGTGSTGPRPAGCLYFRGFTSPSGDSIQVATKVRRYSWSDERTVWRDATITGGENDRRYTLS